MLEALLGGFAQTHVGTKLHCKAIAIVLKIAQVLGLMPTPVARELQRRMEMVDGFVPRACALARPCTDELRTSVAHEYNLAATGNELFIGIRDQTMNYRLNPARFWQSPERWHPGGPDADSDAGCH